MAQSEKIVKSLRIAPETAGALDTLAEEYDITRSKLAEAAFRGAYGDICDLDPVYIVTDDSELVDSLSDVERVNTGRFGE